MSPKVQQQSSNAARSAAFNPQSHAYNPSSQNAGSAMAARSQSSKDARSDAMNPQSHAYNPTSAVGGGGGGSSKSGSHTGGKK